MGVFQLKVTRVGDQLMLAIPDEATSRLEVGEDDVVFLTDLEDGDYRLSANGPAHDDQMTVARRLMTKRRAALNELAA